MYWEILGVTHDADEREIKKAYAALAKKYNPEEHPEEFRKIHEAYKKAVAAAKSRKKRMAEQYNSEENNNGSIVFSEKSDKAQEEEISTENNADRLDFSAVNTDRRPQKKAEEKNPISADLDFSAVGNGTEKKSDSEADAGFDFSNVDTHRINTDDNAYSRSDMMKIMLEHMRRLVSDKQLCDNPEMWKKLLNTYEFEDMASFPDFRNSARDILHGKRFNKQVAYMIAVSFSGNSRPVQVTYPDDSWEVVISDSISTRRKLYPNYAASYSGTYDRSKEKPLPKWVSAAVVIVAIVIFIVLPVFWITTDYSDFQADKTHSEPIYESSPRYEDIVGTWQWNYGTITFNEDKTYEMKTDGKVKTGSVRTEYSESDSRFMTMKIRGMEFTVMLSMEGDPSIVMYSGDSAYFLYRAETTE